MEIGLIWPREEGFAVGGGVYIPFGVPPVLSAVVVTVFEVVRWAGCCEVS